MADYLVVVDAVEEEDEESLQTVEDGEQVGHGHGGLVEVQQTEGPRQSQHEDQHESSADPTSTKQLKLKLISFFLLNRMLDAAYLALVSRDCSLLFITAVVLW